MTTINKMPACLSAKTHPTFGHIFSHIFLLDHFPFPFGHRNVFVEQKEWKKETANISFFLVSTQSLSICISLSLSFEKTNCRIKILPCCYEVVEQSRGLAPRLARASVKPTLVAKVVF